MANPQIATFMIPLEWLSFNVDLNTVNTWMIANAGNQYCGSQAHNQLELWFLSDPGDSVKSAIATYYAGLNESSSEATSYQSQDQIKAVADASAASGKAKLKALGLSDAEIAAMLG